MNALWSSLEGDTVVSGGSDGRVMVWTAREEKGGIRLVPVTEFTISGSLYVTRLMGFMMIVSGLMVSCAYVFF